jgi:hypothetical protein
MERFMIKVHIEQLVLEGLPVGRSQGPLVQEAVQAELSRLLVEGGLGPELAAGGAVPSVPAESIRLVGGGPAQMGRQIARSVYGGMNR